MKRLGCSLPAATSRRYRKKPIAIEAVQWFPSLDFCSYDDNGKYRNHRIGYDEHGVEFTVTEVGLRTKEGFMRIKPGDWIITGVEGERYACDAGIFAKTYEPVGIESEIAESDEPRLEAQEVLERWNHAVEECAKVCYAKVIDRQNAFDNGCWSCGEAIRAMKVKPASAVSATDALEAALQRAHAFMAYAVPYFVPQNTPNDEMAREIENECRAALEKVGYLPHERTGWDDRAPEASPPSSIEASDDDLPGMLAVAKGVAEQKFPHTMDAAVWAAEFVKLNPGADEGLMLSWFANAIMAGYDTAQARIASASGESDFDKAMKLYPDRAEHHEARAEDKKTRRP